MSLLSPKKALGASLRLAKAPVEIALGAADSLRSRASGGSDLAAVERERAESIRAEAGRAEAQAQRQLDADERMVAEAAEHRREQNKAREEAAKLEQLAAAEKKLAAEEAALKAEKEAKRLKTAAAKAKQARKNGTS